jgi:hypothetical protein
MKEIKVDWCKNWIKHTFKKLPFENGGIEVNYFWSMAEKSGIWVRGTYGSSMSKALEELTKVETIQNENRNFLYNVFKLA